MGDPFGIGLKQLQATPSYYSISMNKRMYVCNIYVWKVNLDWLLLGFLYGIVILLSETAATAFSFLIRSTSGNTQFSKTS